MAKSFPATSSRTQHTQQQYYSLDFNRHKAIKESSTTTSSTSTTPSELAYEGLKDYFKFTNVEERASLDELWSLVSQRDYKDFTTDYLLDLHNRYYINKEPIQSLLTDISEKAQQQHEKEEEKKQQQLKQASESRNNPRRVVRRDVSTPGLEMMCKICLDKSVGVVLFPCSHAATCSNCAIAIFECPVCRSAIKGIINAKF